MLIKLLEVLSGERLVRHDLTKLKYLHALYSQVLLSVLVAFLSEVLISCLLHNYSVIMLSFVFEDEVTDGNTSTLKVSQCC